jgi:hypothetical protein
MSGAGGKTILIVRRCAVTVALAVKRLTRPIRGYGAHPWRRGFPWFDDPQRLAIAAAVVVAVFVAGMILIDASAPPAAQRLPHGVVWFFDTITDFGKSAWFLWPLGIFFLALAALPQTLSAMSRAVVAALMVRVGFLFVAIGAPGLFAAIVKNMIGRARPGVGGSVNPYLFDPFHWTPAYAGLPSGHSTAAFACRHRRRPAGAALVCPATAGFCDPGGWAPGAISGSVAAAHQISCPRAVGLIKSSL